MPQRLARRFERVRPYRIFTRDEWLLAQDAAFDAWRRDAFPWVSSRCRVAARLGTRDIDFSRNVWQLLGIEFEALFLLSAMLRHGQRPGAAAASVIEPWIARAFTRSELDRLFGGIRIMASPANRWLESLHQWTISAAHLARELSFVVRGLFTRGTAKHGRIAWLGISPQEIADRDDRLDFAWAARFGYVPAHEVVFFLPAGVTPAQRSHYARNGIQFIEPQDAFELFGRGRRLWLASAMIIGFAVAAMRVSAVAPFLARLVPRARYWEAAFDALGTAVYVTSTSYSWPEKPEVAVARTRGIRTIIWAYSANSPTFAIESTAFRDVGVLRSVVVAREFWVWNQAYARWLDARQVEEGGARCDVLTVGPLMCGDGRRLDFDRGDARSRLGLPVAGTCVAIFDMPPMNDLWRDTFGGGPPMIDIESYIAFWEAVERLLVRVPGCFALLKLKREMGHTWRAAPATLQRLVDREGEHARAGRIVVIDVNVDPYLPIAACDVAIGIPYTSPVLAAHAIGRPAFYLDPLKRAKRPSEPQYRNISIQSEDEAAAIITAATRGEAIYARGVEALTPPRMTVPL